MKKHFLSLLLWVCVFFAVKFILLNLGVNDFSVGFWTAFFCCLTQDVFNALYPS
jgi:hypothetical protein